MGDKESSFDWIFFQRLCLAGTVVLAITVWTVFREYISNFITQFDFKILIGILLVLVVGILFGCLTSAILYAAIFMRRRELAIGPLLSEIKQVATELREAAKLSAYGLDVVPNARMGDLEISIEADEIWLCSPDLHREATRDAKAGKYLANEWVIKNLLGKNRLGKPLRYRYFSLGTRNRGPTRDILRELYRQWLETAVFFHYLSEEQWLKMPYTDCDLIIFIRFTNNGDNSYQLPNAYHELLVADRGLWLKIPDETAIAWVERIREIIPDAANRSN